MNINTSYEQLGYAAHEMRSQHLALLGVIDTLNTIDADDLHGCIELEQLIARITDATARLNDLQVSIRADQQTLSQQPRGGGGL